MPTVRLICVLLCLLPFHSTATYILVQRLYNNSAADSLLAVSVNVLTVVLAMPFLFPLLLMDPDGELVPSWMQAISVPLNSILWLAIVTLAVAGARRIIRQLWTHRSAV